MGRENPEREEKEEEERSRKKVGLGLNAGGSARPLPRAQELDASDGGAELGASHSGAEPRIHF